MKKILLCLLTVILFFPYSLKGQITHTLNPSDDTYVYRDNTIRGMEHSFKTYHSIYGSQFRRVSFLKFDISGLSVHIESVKLRLYIDDLPAGGNANHEFMIYPVAVNSWSEDDITFENYKEKVGDDLNSPLLGSFVIPAGEAFSAQYIEFSSQELTNMLITSLEADVRYFSVRMRERYSVKDPQGNGVIVDFHSKENPSGNAPELVIEEKDIELLKASDIMINDVSVDGFNENTYKYVYYLPWDETVVPTVSATAKYEGISVNVTQAVANEGSQTDRTASVTMNNGNNTLVYRVVFQLLPPPTNADLTSVTINGEPLEFFSHDKQSYLVYLPFSLESVPIVDAHPADPLATYEIFEAGSISPSAQESGRTTTIAVTSANGEVYKAYKVIFYQLPELELVLAIGQSNMSGRAPFDERFAEDMENVYLLTPAGNMEVSANPMNKHSNIRKDLSLQHLGPSYSCALTLRDALDKNFGFVVNAEGGSSIESWYGPGKRNYDATLSRALLAQQYGSFKAIIWHQGSSDNSSGLEDNFASYKNRLATMVQNFRNDLNAPDLIFVIGELSEREVFDQFNLIVVNDVESYIPNSGYIVTDGTNMLSDNIHFDVPSNILMGERYANKILEMVYTSTNILSPLHSKDSSVKVLSGKEFIRIDDIVCDVNLNIYTIEGFLINKVALEKNGPGFYGKMNSGIYVVVLKMEGEMEVHKVIVR